EDVDITKRLKEAGTLLGIQILDHIIIGNQGYVSLREKGLL
ncbi:MAG: DNA repair protein RadC, partial [Firmicutes bacterium]|nr:DNA repair protein RadC [Bacillota bacterium]